MVQSAIQHAIAQSGVAVITLPGDIAEEPAEGTAPPLARTGAPSLVPADEDVQALADAVNEASAVAIFAGAGVRGARDELLALADTIGAPIGHTLRGKEWIQYDNPFDVGMTGLLGYGAAHDGIHDADLLILVGTDFPYDQFLPGDVRTAQIDVAAQTLGRRTGVDLPVHGDTRSVLRALQPLVHRKSSRSFLEKTLDRHEKLMTKVVGAYTEPAKQRVPIHPEYAASILDDIAADDAVFTADTGMCNVWTARYLNPNGRRRFLSSALHGSMANALPHAIGAQFAEPGRQVVAMSGDGGLSMLLGELITVAMYRLPVKIVVFDNSTLGMVKLEMLVDGLPDFGVDVPSVDYAAVATALGLYGRRIEDPADLESGLREAFAHDGPALIDIVTDPNALSLPPSITGGQVRGFALAMSKMVMNGGVAEAFRWPSRICATCRDRPSSRREGDCADIASGERWGRLRACPPVVGKCMVSNSPELADLKVTSPALTADEIDAAAERIAHIIDATPLQFSERLSALDRSPGLPQAGGPAGGALVQTPRCLQPDHAAQ